MHSMCTTCWRQLLWLVALDQRNKTPQTQPRPKKSGPEMTALLLNSKTCTPPAEAFGAHCTGLVAVSSIAGWFDCVGLVAVSSIARRIKCLVLNTVSSTTAWLALPPVTVTKMRQGYVLCGENEPFKRFVLEICSETERTTSTLTSDHSRLQRTPLQQGRTRTRRREEQRRTRASCLSRVWWRLNSFVRSVLWAQCLACSIMPMRMRTCQEMQRCWAKILLGQFCDACANNPKRNPKRLFLTWVVGQESRVKSQIPHKCVSYLLDGLC